MLLFELAIPALAIAIGQSKTTTINYGVMFAPMFRIIGGFFAVAILVFGIRGAVIRFMESRRARRVFERAVERPA